MSCSLMTRTNALSWSSWISCTSLRSSFSSRTRNGKKTDVGFSRFAGCKAVSLSLTTCWMRSKATYTMWQGKFTMSSSPRKRMLRIRRAKIKIHCRGKTICKGEKVLPLVLRPKPKNYNMKAKDLRSL